MSDSTGRGVIVNADDFGLTPGVNRGILSGFREGILTSTTMMVNMRFFDDAATLARDNADLPVGVHLTLLWGRPVSDAARVPSLVDRQGCFPRGLVTLARGYAMGRLDPEQVETEFRAQIRKFVEAGLRPTHLDTHKHVHCLPGVLQAMIAVAPEFGIDRVRLPVELPLKPLTGAGGPTPRRPSLTATAKRRLIGALCGRSRGRLQAAGFRTTDHFVGIAQQDRLNSEVFRLILNSLRDGVTEIMCHPGYSDDHLGEYSSVPPYRELELAGLKDPAVRATVEANAVRLMHYGEL
jgi:hopanoid biosynthesis associated protein HpnK